jgi:hypothetical protein
LKRYSTCVIHAEASTVVLPLPEELMPFSSIRLRNPKSDEWKPTFCFPLGTSCVADVCGLLKRQSYWVCSDENGRNLKSRTKRCGCRIHCSD